MQKLHLFFLLNADFSKTLDLINENVQTIRGFALKGVCVDASVHD